MTTSREHRLQHEFQRMLALRRPGGLIDFQCADLSAREAESFLSPSMRSSVITEALRGFLTPDEFSQRFPGRAPEKYLVTFRCVGLMKEPNGDIVETVNHAFEVVFAHDYPSKPPRFVWLTPIWHPNIVPPYLCAEGRPFAISTTLDQISLMAGQMIQYRIYSLGDPLGQNGKEVALWAAQNSEMFPVDTRGLLDGKEHSRPLVTLIDGKLLEWTDDPTTPPTAHRGAPGKLVEMV